MNAAAHFNGGGAPPPSAVNGKSGRIFLVVDGGRAKIIDALPKNDDFLKDAQAGVKTDATLRHQGQSGDHSVHNARFDTETCSTAIEADTFHHDASDERQTNADAVSATANAVHSEAEAARAITLTVIEVTVPTTLSKQFFLRPDGTLEKHSGGQLEEGKARKLTVDGPASFAALLADLGPHQALMHGVFPHDEAIVLSKKRRERTLRQKRQHPIVTRTKEDTSWPAGPGMMMLDYDPDDGHIPLTAEALRETVCEAAPSLRDAPHIARPSASSCIFAAQDGGELRGVRGQRLYVPVRDARDIERAGSVLAARLWLQGHGRYIVSKSGHLLDRTLIDTSVFQPSRLDFAGGAKCGEGVTQRLPAPEVFNPNGPYLDTAIALPNLTGDEHRRLSDLKKAAREGKAPDVKVARERWIEERIAAFESALEEREPAKRDARIKVYSASCRAAVEDGRLFGDFEIMFDDRSTATVGEILDNSAKYHNRKTRDPLEPDYDGGRPVGWINLRAGGSPYLWSYAHGGRRFRLIRARKTVVLAVGERAETFSRVMELLRLEGALFERGGLLTRVIGNRTTPVTVEWLLLHLDRTVRFETFRKTKEGEFVAVPQDAPEWVAKRIIKADGERDLPQLNAVLDAPTLDPKTGRIIAEDGFDDTSGLYLQLPPNVEPINEHADEAEAREALRTLWRPFEKFPFADAMDATNGRLSRSVFLSAALTAVVRRLLPTAPGYLISATAPASGKTLLALCLATFTSNGDPDVLGVPEGIDESELSKLLLAKAINGAPTLLFDNVAGVFKSAALCGFLTSSVYEGRILGVSNTARVPTNSLLVLNGNQPIIVGDLNRRLLRCNLDPRTETPHKRAFDLDPVEHCRTHRLDIVRAALTILTAWHNAGRQKFAKDRTASFEPWSDTIRQAVIWVGEKGWLDVTDPVASIDAGFEADPDTRKLDALLQAWDAQFRGARQPIKALRCYEMKTDTDLFEAIEEIGVIENGRLNTRRLGRWIEQRAGRVVDGRRFVNAGILAGTKQWSVEVGVVGVGGC